MQRYSLSFIIKRFIHTIKIAVVGSGPAGFYTTQALLKNKHVVVDIYEKFPVPFGLIRFGVAPDHQSVKNVIKSFTTTALESRVKFFGNISIGKDLSLNELREAYNAVVLCYGSSQDKTLDIKGENLKNVLPARRFVGWYNGIPSDKDIDINLNVNTSIIIGQGNVAIDCARILLSSVNEVLKKTDITNHALQSLKNSRINQVYIVGRRGPLQVSFTIKEFRELTKLPNCDTIISSDDFLGIDSNLLDTLPRPRKRLTEFLQSIARNDLKSNFPFKCHLLFYRSPLEIIGQNEVSSILFGINKLDENGKAILTDKRETLSAGLVLRSIGYKTLAIDENIPIYKEGIIANVRGKVLDFEFAKSIFNNKENISDAKFAEGLYCSGWAATGATGVIMGTMSSAFETAGYILEDIEKNSGFKSKFGNKLVLEILKARQVKVVSFSDWQKIDEFEKSIGQKYGKPREKLVNKEEMLDILKTNLDIQQT